ncbi:TetR/AcrR family transcriptional regulator [Altericroceibacterium spongiae]|uniref:TetR/AcrR family transcriptional regulator n=1 Tax=Altericroceibacterium spongiae TaxID=2320269 RepID=A0A420EQQ0_9SPHN|nr:TetR/AcrR family transcriptional regulator [Altericroceibacterium spongiae]RKF23002.1 TetR/AcrR family transcriptional regulator [Altericroceibacterium spongiae]
MTNSCAEKNLCKRDAKKEEKRAAIVAIAQQHFTEHGFGGTTMSAIAADLGGSKTTLWSYFSSKEDLFAAALDDWIDIFEPVRNIRYEGDLRETLVSYCCDFLNQMLTPQVETMFRLVIAEAKRFPELGQIFYEQAPLRRHKALSAFLQQEMDSGRLRQYDSVRMSSQLHHLCLYRLFMHSIWGLEPDTSPAQIRLEAENVVDLFLNGYAAA